MLNNLIDEQTTKLMSINLDTFANNAASILETIFERAFGIVNLALVDYEDAHFRRSIESNAIKSVVLLIHSAHLLSPLLLQKLFSVLAAYSLSFKLCLVIDDLTMLSRLPLPVQMGLDLTKVEGLSDEQLVVDLISHLLFLKYLPSPVLVETLLLRPSAFDRLKTTLRMAILELDLFNGPRDAPFFLSIPSFQQYHIIIIITIGLCHI